MSFQAPVYLWALLILPVLAYLYWRARQGRGQGFVWLPDLERVRLASGVTRSWPGWLAVGLYGVSMALALLALAKPTAALPTPDEQAGVVLAIDVSGSMMADDLKPSRLDAAKAAARSFVERMPAGVKVGLVSFAAGAVLESGLTADHQGVIERIDLLERRANTAIGEGLLESLKAFPTGANHQVAVPATVILLSDGRNRIGIAPQEAAQEAKRRGVRVFTIGVGSDDPNASVDWAGFDEAELRGIAEVTGGRYFAADSADRLQEIYRELGSQVGWKLERTQVSGLVALLAGFCLALSLMVSWGSRRLI